MKAMHGHVYGPEGDCPGPANCECHDGQDRPHWGHGHRQRRGGWAGILFLRLLDEKPMHGYQLMEELNRRSLTAADRIEPGAIYTALRRMEHRGLLESRWEEKEAGPDRRVYKLTEEGRKVLKQGLEMVKLQKAILDDLSSYYDSHFKTA